MSRSKLRDVLRERLRGLWQLSVLAAVLVAGGAVVAGELTGHKLLLTSVRSGDTELFVVDPQWGDAQFG